MDDSEAFTLEIPHHEWQRIVRLSSLIENHSGDRFGLAWLSLSEAPRRWAVGSQFVMAMVSGADDASKDEVVLLDIGLPVEVMREFGSAVPHDGMIQLDVWPEEWGMLVTVSAGPVEFRYRVAYDQAPDPRVFLERTNEEIRAVASVRVGDLATAVAVANRRRRAAIEESNDENWLCHLWVEDGALVVETSWDRLPQVQTSVHATAVAGRATERFNPVLLAMALQQFSPDEEVTVSFGAKTGSALAILGSDLGIAVMPMRSPADMLREKVEKVIAEAVGELAIHRDDDGDYPLRRGDVPIYARLHADGHQTVVQVFAVLLDGIEPSPDLHRELNDVNTLFSFARVFYVDNQVLAEADLVAETMDCEELVEVVERIELVAEKVVPTLAVVLGGQRGNWLAVERRSNYRSTIIDAELWPGQFTALNGLNAIGAWPFDGAVHVLTGWNPYGVAVSERRNVHVTRELSMDVIRKGGHFLRGLGRSTDGEYSEPSIVALFLEREDAVELGRRASQEAIFEIDEDTVRLIPCDDGELVEWSRHEA